MKPINWCVCVPYDSRAYNQDHWEIRVWTWNGLVDIKLSGLTGWKFQMSVSYAGSDISHIIANFCNYLTGLQVS